MTLKSLGLALDVLEMFTKDTPSWGLRDLSKEMNVNHTILYRILKTYEEKKIIIQDQNTKKYHLGPGLAGVLSAYLHQNKLSDFVYPVMQELSQKTGESVFLTWLINDTGVTVEIAEGPSNIRFAVSKGTVSPLHAGASSKSILAFIPLGEQERILENELMQLTLNTRTEKEELFLDIEEIKRDGWAYTVGEFSDDVFGLSVPIFDQTGEVLASLTIAGPAYRINEERKMSMLSDLKKSVGQVTEFISLFDKKFYY